jgi:hypothetical protein
MLRRVIYQFFQPPVLMSVMTLAPFAIYWSDFLSEKSLYLSRQVGFDWIAFTYAWVCACAFLMAYKVGLTFRPRIIVEHLSSSSAIDLRHPWRACLAAWLVVIILSTIGLGVTVFTVTREGGDYLSEIISRFVAAESATDLLYSSQGFILSETVPGIVRMLGAWSSAAVILWLALARAPWRTWLNRLYWPTLAFLLTLNFGRAIIGGDRTAALAAFVLAFYVLFVEKHPGIGVGHVKLPRISQFMKRLSGVLGALILVTAGLVAYESLGKLRGGQEYNTLLLYGDLGVANLSLAIQTGHGWTYGLTALLNPVYLVFKVFNVEIDWPSFTSDYISSPPGNLLMYSYWDFHLFGFMVYIIIGLIAAWVYVRYSHQSQRIVWRVAYLHVLYGLSTSFTVPCFTGPQYWAGLLASLIAAWYLDLYARKRGSHRWSKVSKPLCQDGL